MANGWWEVCWDGRRYGRERVDRRLARVAIVVVERCTVPVPVPILAVLGECRWGSDRIQHERCGSTGRRDLGWGCGKSVDRVLERCALGPVVLIFALVLINTVLIIIDITSQKILKHGQPNIGSAIGHGSRNAWAFSIVSVDARPRGEDW